MQGLYRKSHCTLLLASKTHVPLSLLRSSRSSSLQLQCHSTTLNRLPRGSQLCSFSVHDRPAFVRRNLQYRAALPAALASTATWNLAGHLVGAGLFLVGFSALVFVVTAIPAILTARQTMLELQQVLRTLDRELPDTAAAIRLSGLELSDAIEEVSLLSTDLTQGVRATASMVTGTHSSIREGVELAGAAFNGFVLPAVRQRVPAARSAVEARLQERARMKHTAPSVAELACSTKVAAKQARAVLAAADLAGLAARLLGSARALRSSSSRPAPT